MYQKYQTLEELWAVVDDLNHKHFPKNSLKPILGNGKIFRPKVMFVFINPTHANISSDQNWQGPRFPFIGTKPVWRIFHKAGMFDDELIERINHLKSWSLEFTDEVLNFLKSKSCGSGKVIFKRKGKAQVNNNGIWVNKIFRTNFLKSFSFDNQPRKKVSIPATNKNPTQRSKKTMNDQLSKTNRSE